MQAAKLPKDPYRSQGQTPTSQNVRDHGYAYVSGKDLACPTHLTEPWEALKSSFAHLPLDRHSSDGNRFRRYSQFIALPWRHTFELLPPVWDARRGEEVTEYFQDTSYNPTDGGQSRTFAALAPSQRQNPFLTWLLEYDLRQIPWTVKELHKPLLVGVHQVKHVASTGRAAASSPDCLHQDGEPFTFVHLIERSANVVGGINTIAPTCYKNRQPSDVPPHDILAQFTLTNFLDSFVVADARVCHHVSAIDVMPAPEDAAHRRGGNSGVRSVLLIDFTPLVPRIG